MEEVYLYTLGIIWTGVICFFTSSLVIMGSMWDGMGMGMGHEACLCNLQVEFRVFFFFSFFPLFSSFGPFFQAPAFRLFTPSRDSPSVSLSSCLSLSLSTQIRFSFSVCGTSGRSMTHFFFSNRSPFY